MIYSVYNSSSFATEAVLNESADSFKIYESSDFIIVNEGVVGTILEKIGEFIKKVIEFIVDIIKKIGDFLGSLFKSSKDGVSNTAKAAANSIVNHIKNDEYKENDQIVVRWFDITTVQKDWKLMVNNTKKFNGYIKNFSKYFHPENSESYRELMKTKDMQVWSHNQYNKDKEAGKADHIHTQGAVSASLREELENIKKMPYASDVYTEGKNSKKITYRSGDGSVMIYPEIMKEELENNNTKYLKDYKSSIKEIRSLSDDSADFYSKMGINSKMLSSFISDLYANEKSLKAESESILKQVEAAQKLSVWNASSGIEYLYSKLASECALGVKNIGITAKNLASLSFYLFNTVKPENFASEVKKAIKGE